MSGYSIGQDLDVGIFVTQPCGEASFIPYCLGVPSGKGKV